MIIYLAGGYLKPTADILKRQETNRLFSYYDVIENRVITNKIEGGMNQRFQDIIKLKKKMK